MWLTGAPGILGVRLQRGGYLDDATDRQLRDMCRVS